MGAEAWDGAACDTVGVPGATRSLDANGLENGFSDNRMVSELHAAAALPINPTRAIRDTVAQCPEPTRKRMTKNPNRTQLDGAIKSLFRLNNG